MKQSLFVLICILLLAAMVSFLFYNLSQDSKKRNAVIGSKVVIGKDTLIVIGKSMFTTDYNLSNGISVSEELVIKNKIK